MQFDTRMAHRLMAVCVVVLVTAVNFSLIAGAQEDATTPTNSTRKIRVQPSPLASQIGSGIEWETSLQSAMRSASETGRLVFWYIPTIPGTFMDRKTEIDRYMMAGPFSWRFVREFLARHCIAVKAVPSRQQQKQFGLERYGFIEPGCWILNSDGVVLKRLDRLTTLHPDWWQAVLRSVVSEEFEPSRIRPEIAAAWQRIALRQFGESWPSSSNDWSPAERLEWEWLRGVDQYRSGEHQSACETWKMASEQFPTEPFAWKLAAEAEGFGPFVRGFEIYDPLPKSLLNAVHQEWSISSAAGSGMYSEEEIWERSVNFLLGMQRIDGGWRDSDYDFGGTDSLPNVYVAVSALCGLALWDARERLPHRKSEIQTALDRLTQFLIDESNLNRADRDELTWAQAYRIQFLAKCVSHHPELHSPLQSAVRELEQFQSPNGGWFHEYRNPFVSATALVALADARDAGASIDQLQMDKGVRSLGGDRFENGAFPYNSRRGKQSKDRTGTTEDIQAGVGRNPICELALLKWGASNADALEATIKRSFEFHNLLQKALKYDNHTDQMAYGGFFFWYGVYGRSLAIANLPDRAQRNEWFRQQRDLILSLPEIDGCFVDSHELGRCYGTAMALLSLARSK